MNIDLRQYVVAGSEGPWLKDAEAFTPNELRLGSARDIVTLAGPLRVRVCVQARNHFTLYNQAAVALQARDVFGYTLEIPPGQTWTYPRPRGIVGEIAPAQPAPAPATQPSIGRVVDATGAVLEGVRPAETPAATTLSPNAAALLVNPAAIAVSPYVRELLLGTNAGFGISIRPVAAELCADPCAPDPCRPDPCAPKKPCHCGGGCGGDCGCGGECGGRCGGGCGCKCETHGDDLPCDFATGRGSHLGMFFPAACEPCAPGAFVGMPALKGPSLLVPAARGGTVRTRYFNGMFITKEDLWTDQNNNRIKHALMNRAMGQGVVWGFPVCLDGDAVCVLPGYGVDCCGNDIVLSCSYRVDAGALVRDPAAAATLSKRGPQRMNLLLEYYECPEEPRPVHGDPCAPDSVRCETSRIRETARLRLVPPCDVDDSGCIKDFLDDVRKLKGDPVVGPILNVGPTVPMVPAPAPAPAPPITTTSTATSVPFRIVFKSVSGGSKTENPLPGSTVTDSLGLKVNEPLTIAIQPEAGASFLAGSVELTSGPGSPSNVVPTLAPGGGDWLAKVPAAGGIEFVAVSWSAKAGDGARYDGVTKIALQRVREEPKVTVKIAGEARVTRTEQPPEPQPQPQPQPPPPTKIPCWSEACDPEGRPRFPAPIPWMHADPADPTQAADPKVIVLAIFYALVVSKMVQKGPGVSDEVVQEQQALAKALNISAWKVLYEKVPDDERLGLVDGLRRLLQCWCKLLLYPGPRCECGCEPHGVVIGCALVEGGSIRMVDPWGGRRWVVHYPLLSYWGKQFGIMPLDALASKFFDLICCVASLYPAPTPTKLLVPAPVRLDAALVARAPVVRFGSAALIFDQPVNLPGRFAELGVAPERTVEISPMDFVGRVIRSMNVPEGAPPTGPLVHYTVAGLGELHLVAPADPASTQAPGSTQPIAAPQPSEPSPAAPVRSSRFGELVRKAVANRPARAPQIPPLLREFSELLTRGILDAMPLEPATDEGRGVREALSAAGIRTIADLLESRPEDLHVDVLNRANAAGLAELLDASEKATASVAKAVGDTVAKFAADRRLVTRDDLRDTALAAEFRGALTEALKGAMPEERVGEEVDRAAGLVI